MSEAATKTSSSSTSVAPPETLQLWEEVGSALDTSQTVVWRNAVASLRAAKEHYDSTPQAGAFAERYMLEIVEIMVAQQPHKIGPVERECVRDSLTAAMDLIMLDLTKNSNNNAAVPQDKDGQKKTIVFLTTLGHILNKEKKYYSDTKGGLPEVHDSLTNRFVQANGLLLLTIYLQAKQVERLSFYEIYTPCVHRVLVAILPILRQPTNLLSSPIYIEKAIWLGKVIMAWVRSWTNDDLNDLHNFYPGLLTPVENDLCALFDLVADKGYREETHDFYTFWRDLARKLLFHPKWKIYSWTHVLGRLVKASARHRPPPRAYAVQGAGLVFCNGRYEYAGQLTADGYAMLGQELVYRLSPPEDGPGGKTLTMSRWTVRSRKKSWFICEVDEEQPGTDKDIDFYIHKSPEEETYPPQTGWTACHSNGKDPPPTVRPESGLIVPLGQESKTLEHELVKWAMNNEIIEQVMADDTIPTGQSAPLANFMEQMQERFPLQLGLQGASLVSLWAKFASAREAVDAAAAVAILADEDE